MKSPLVLFGLAGAAYFATRKKPTSGKKDTKVDPKKEEPKTDDTKVDDNKNLPQVDNGKDLPQVDEKDPVEEAEEKVEVNLAKEYYDPYYSETNLAPAVMDANTIWISNDCLSWGVGKNYKLALPEKYLYAQPVNPDKLVTPWEWWDKIGAKMTPAPWYLNSYQGDIPARAFVANVIDLWNKCPVSPPRRKDFKNYSEYQIVVKKFAATPLGKLFSYLIDRATDEMYSNWENKYPNEALIETFKGWALKAIIEYPKKTTNEQTSIAYHWAFEGTDAPQKIEPNNPAHKQYLDAWIRINIEVKNYKGLIKQYGL